MKKLLVGIVLVSTPLIGQSLTTSLGSVEAIQREIPISGEECLRALRVSSKVIGGPYHASVNYTASCEIKLPESDKIIYSDQIAETFGEQIRLTADAKSYRLSWDVDTDVFASDKERHQTAAKLVERMPPKLITVKALRTVR